MKARSKWFPALFFLLLPAIPLWKTLFYGLCIGPFDQIKQMLPWNGPAPSQPWDVLQADGVLQFYPWRDLVFRSWSHLQPPYWNPYELAGTPLLANSQSAGFYPPHILVGLLHLPTSLAIVLLAWAHLSWAGLGTYRLGRRMGGCRLAATLGGASFVLSPFMLSWTALSSVISTVAWIPWCLALVYDAFDPAHIRSKSNVLLGLCIGMMVLAGHLQFAAYGFIAIGLTAVCCALWSDVPKQIRGVGFIAVIGALLVGIFLSAPQLAPVLSFSKTSNRQNKPSDEGYHAYVASAVQPFEFSTLSNALALGNPRESADEKEPGLSTYWPGLAKSGANFAESAISIGPFVLALFALVNWKNRRVLPMLVVGCVGLLLCAGTALNKVLYFYAPGWSASGSPGRIGCLLVLSACVLVGSIDFGLTASSRKRLYAAGALLVLGLATSLLLPSLSPEVSARIARPLAAVQGASQFGALACLVQGTALAVVGVGLLAAAKARRFRTSVIAIPILISVVGGGLELVSTGTPLPPIEGPADQSRVAYLNQVWELFQATKANTPPNLASENGIHELGGYDSLLNADTVNLLHEVNGEDPAPQVNGNMMFIKNANVAELQKAGVSYIGDGTSLKPIPDAPGRCSISRGSAKIESETLEQIRLEVNGSGTLILRDRNMQGWTATVDGKPASIAAGIWRQVNISTAGAHAVVFSYTPPGLREGLILEAIGILCTFGMLLIKRRPV